MNTEELRDYCLSLSADVEEKFPFQQFKAAKDVLAFYISGHMFCYFDINDLHHVTVKCRKDDIPSLLEQHSWLSKPYNGNPKYWIGIDATKDDTEIVRKLIEDSFFLVRKKKR
ncbi:MAG: MmcQ/YjbR family DNA-binding protein [Prevotella sp.]|nr:MmcQ/YjbR family DNA-binding protein [Prevotella sp.]